MEQEANLIRRDRRFVCGEEGREGDSSEGQGKGGTLGHSWVSRVRGLSSPTTEPLPCPQP